MHHRLYGVFEVLPDGTTEKMAEVSGLEFAKVALGWVAERTANECFAADAITRQVVAQRNVSDSRSQSAATYST